MAGYKAMYLAEKERADALQRQIDEMASLDGMCGDLNTKDAKDFVLAFADRCQNRAEVNMLIRVANQLGA